LRSRLSSRLSSILNGLRLHRLCGKLGLSESGGLLGLRGLRSPHGKSQSLLGPICPLLLLLILQRKFFKMVVQRYYSAKVAASVPPSAVVVAGHCLRAAA
jgi:hypothetical protein